MTLHINTNRIYLQIVTNRVVADEGIHTFIEILYFSAINRDTKHNIHNKKILKNKFYNI